MPDDGAWSTILEYLVARFPNDEIRLREKVAAKEVVDERGLPITESTQFTPRKFVYLYRDPPVESRVPFEIEILHRDENLLVVDKPHFLASTPRGAYVAESALVRLRRALDLPDLTPAHRLDRLTAGVLIFTVRREVRRDYQLLFERRQVTKEYEALARYDSGLELPTTVRSRIVKDRGVLKAYEVDGPANSESRIELLETRGEAARYLLVPHTGKTHQLRVHMSSLGIPIFGDNFYPDFYDVAAEDYSTPLSLLARSVEFRDPYSGALRRFESRASLDWPDDTSLPIRVPRQNDNEMTTATPEAVSEVERKYEAGAEQQIPSLSGLPGVEGEPRIDSIRLSALYYDTSDLRLLTAGITLRRREGGEDAGWHLKLPAGADARTELQLPPEAAEPDIEVPTPYTDLLTAITRGAAVNPVALISTDRERHRLLDSSGTALAEVVSDVVIAAVPDGSAGPDERVWREIEVEQGAGGQKLLDAIDSRLRDCGMVRSENPSKLRRALGDTVVEPLPPRLTKGANKKLHPRRLLREYLDEQVHALTRADIEVRRDTEDSVHALRVAARRIRSVLQVYGAHLGERETAEDLVGELRWLGQSLGGARDAQVQWSRLVAALDEIPEMPDREIVRARIDEYFSGLFAAARPEALATLDSDRYLALLSALDGFVDGIESGTGSPSVKQVAATLRKLTRSVERRVRRARKAETRADRDVLMHQARKRSKQMRYAIEATQQLSPGRSERALDAFKEFQDLLGDYQDAVMSRQHLLRMAAEDQHPARSSLGCGMLFHRNLVIGDSLAAQLKADWKSVRKSARKILK